MEKNRGLTCKPTQLQSPIFDSGPQKYAPEKNQYLQQMVLGKPGYQHVKKKKKKKKLEHYMSCYPKFNSKHIRDLNTRHNTPQTTGGKWRNALQH